MPILLVDCDGVLTDQLCLFSALNKELGKDKKFEDCFSYHLHEVWETKPEEIDEALNRIEKTFSYESVDPARDAIEAIGQLQKKFKVIILTARKPQHESATKVWAKKYFKNLDIIFARTDHNRHGNNSPETKLEVCKRLNAFALIEDNPHELLDLAKQKISTQTICFNAPYNQDLDKNKKIFRGNWIEIRDHLLGQF